MKCFLTTYQDNLDFAFATKFILQEEWNIETTLILGNKIDDVKYTRTKVVHWNWIEKSTRTN